MILDCDKYRVNIPTIKRLIENNKEDALHQSSMIAMTLNVPIIITICYVCELTGFTDKALEQLQNLMQFYKVTGVINVINSDGSKGTIHAKPQ